MGRFKLFAPDDLGQIGIATWLLSKVFGGARRLDSREAHDRRKIGAGTGPQQPLYSRAVPEIVRESSEIGS